MTKRENLKITHLRCYANIQRLHWYPISATYLQKTEEWIRASTIARQKGDEEVKDYILVTPGLN